MRTFVASAKSADSRWHVIDANGQVLGRVATLAAKLLQGKLKPTYIPFIDMGDHVVIVNAATVNLPAISRVQILIDGKEVDTLAGHVDLRNPLAKNLTWVKSENPS